MSKPKKASELKVLGKGPKQLDKSFNERAKAFFRERAGVELTDEDVREIVQNLTAYFNLLNELDTEQKRSTE